MTTRHRSAAQLFDLAMGPVLVIVGLAGFIVSAGFSTGEPNGSDLVIFEVNGWHNLVHVASGLLLLAGAATWQRARMVTLLFAATYGLVTIIGWIDGHDVIGLIPVDTADNVLHTFLTLAALAFGLAPAPDGAHTEHLMQSGTGAAGAADGRGRVTGPAELDRDDRFRRGTGVTGDREGRG